MGNMDDHGDPQIKEAIDQENESHAPENIKEGFNWLLPLFGAIGFGVGFAVSGAINATILDIAKNSFKDVFPGTGVGPMVGITRGVIVGAIGGAGLGLAFKDKVYALYFALTGAVGFAIAFALVISLDPDIVPELGRTIIKFMGGPENLSMHEVSLSHGLGTGTIVGAIGGLVLGFASAKGRIMSSILLCLTGMIWFANAFAFGSSIYNGDMHSPWNGWGGAIGGAIFGFTLALYYMLHDKMHPISPAGGHLDANPS
jgi:hypothetical protein